MLDLANILRISVPSTVSIVGAGGKTSTMQRIAESMGKKVIATTTTHISIEQAQAYPKHFRLNSREEIPGIISECRKSAICVTGSSSDGHRLNPIREDLFLEFNKHAHQEGFVLLVEADGSKMLPLKAPGEHEPQIPEWTEQVIVCCGMQGIGVALDDDHVHRADLFAELIGISRGDPVTEDAVARMVSHPNGGLKGIPKDSWVSLILNQADDEIAQAHALRIAMQVGNTAFNQILIASLGSNLPNPCVQSRIEKIAGVVLAAGGAERYGRAKQLLPAHGSTLIRHAVLEGLTAGLDPLIVVTSQYDAEIRAALQGLSVEFSFNPDWKSGQSSSLRKGLQAVPHSCGGAIFLLADQPFVNCTLIGAILEKVQSRMMPVVAPMAGGKRANPVYFDRVTFPELLTLTGDTGGRAIFSKYPPDYLEWYDERILVDIDEVQDYQSFLKMVDEE